MHADRSRSRLTESELLVQEPSIAVGDHRILIGRIVDIKYTDGKPLLYFRRKYGVYELHSDHDVPSVDAWL